MKTEEKKKLSDWWDEWIESQNQRREETNIQPPKYTYGDMLEFECNGKQIGYVYIVDRFGTFEQNEEPSYDIYVPEQNMLYKHVRESWISDYFQSFGREYINEMMDAVHLYYEYGRRKRNEEDSGGR